MRAWTIVSLTLLAALGSAAEADAETPLRVMTYNLRYASDDPPNAWPDRLPVAVAMLNETAPDVVGTQEGLYRQIKDLDAALADYDWIGTGRDGGSRGEFMAVFYRRERLEPLEFDHYWLSDTPDVIGSSTWGNTNRRMVTWVRFRDRSSGRQFYFINTHFDHALQDAREKSAALVLERLPQLNAELPVVLVGDFNAVAGDNPVYAALVTDGPFVDSWTESAQRGPAVATFHGYGAVREVDQRIDWILLRGPVRCDATEIVQFEQDGQRPSDHFPVMADLHFPQTK